MSEIQHTPTPWRFQQHPDGAPGGWLGNIIVSYGLNRHGIEEIRTISCQTRYEGHVGEALANAEFIVRAVNNHDRLIGALEGLLIQAIQSNVSDPANEWGCEAIAKARAAISSAKGVDRA